MPNPPARAPRRGVEVANKAGSEAAYRPTAAPAPRPRAGARRPVPSRSELRRPAPAAGAATRPRTGRGAVERFAAARPADMSELASDIMSRVGTMSAPDTRKKLK